MAPSAVEVRSCASFSPSARRQAISAGASPGSDALALGNQPLSSRGVTRKINLDQTGGVYQPPGMDRQDQVPGAIDSGSSVLPILIPPERAPSFAVVKASFESPRARSDSSPSPPPQVLENPGRRFILERLLAKLSELIDG
jgi:hypothetical protein